MTSIRRAARQKWVLFALIVVFVFAGLFPVILDHNRSVENKRNIRELACILVSQTPDDPAKPLIHEFRAKYHCPPFNPAGVGHLIAPKSPTVTRTVHTPGPTRTHVITGPTVRMPGPTVTVTRTVTRVRIRTVPRTVSPPPCVSSLRPPCVIGPLK